MTQIICKLGKVVASTGMPSERAKFKIEFGQTSSSEIIKHDVLFRLSLCSASVWAILVIVAKCAASVRLNI